MKFDELNRLKKFYSVMNIPQSEKDKRVSLGWLFYDAFYYVLLMMQTETKVKGEIDKDFYVQSLEGRIRDVLNDNNIPYEEEYLPMMVKDVIDTTTRHLSDPYYFSQERALLIAQNESNTVFNRNDYIDAKAKGKKYKTWITEEDSRVRLSHEEVDRVKIPIDEMFHVGNDDMRFPHDYNASPENIINCRCVCEYE